MHALYISISISITPITRSRFPCACNAMTSSMCCPKATWSGSSRLAPLPLPPPYPTAEQLTVRARGSCAQFARARPRPPNEVVVATWFHMGTYTYCPGARPRSRRSISPTAAPAGPMQPTQDPAVGHARAATGRYGPCRALVLHRWAKGIELLNGSLSWLASWLAGSTGPFHHGHPERRSPEWRTQNLSPYALPIPSSMDWRSNANLVTVETEPCTVAVSIVVSKLWITPRARRSAARFFPYFIVTAL